MFLIKLSVRNLVEFILRCGDIDSKYRSAKRAVEGTKIHSRLQKKHKRIAKLKGLSYESEVAVNVQGEFKEFSFDIDGRIDGLVEEFNKDGTKKTLHIEEIKSTTDIESIKDNPEHWHYAQAKCYGYMYAFLEGFSEIVIHLTYCQLETYEEKSFEKTFEFNELKQFFYDLIQKYGKWQKLYGENIIKRNETLKLLKFPFDDFRKGQHDFAKAVYKTIFSGKKLFAQAPTGTGKTISTIFPSLKFMGEQNLLDTKIFYATAKTITRQNAENTIRKLKENGVFLKCVSITAKEKICQSEEKSCTPEKCPFAKGHFDRVNDALFQLITNEELITKDVILKYSQKYTVCPFELTLDATLFSDFIICDYNYVFDPKVQLKRFFGEGEKGSYIVLIDEAHNLSDRAREMYSAELSKDQILNVMKLLKDKKLPLYKSFSKLNRLLLGFKKLLGDEKAIINNKYPEEIVFALMDIQAKCDKWLAKNENESFYEEILNAYFEILDFLRISEFFSTEYIVLSQIDKNDFKIKLLCVNPSKLLQQQEDKFVSSIFFSATLTPIDYFIDILGGSKTDNSICISSPFHKENLEVIIDATVSTKYRYREESVPKIAEKIFDTISKRNKNAFVFFPSYDYMDKIGEYFKEKYVDENNNFELCISPRNLSDDEKELFLNNFSEKNEKAFIAFTVMGGVFSEGIDLIGERLCGVIIVGVGLPLITTERNIIKDYYDKRNVDGFDYAYTYPGFNKVLQAAGRVIRTETDKGYVKLIDSRFGEWKYKKMFPPWWK